MTETSPASPTTPRESAHAFSGTALSALASRPRGGPPWLEERRAEAASRFDATGFPAPNDEAFRFTELGRVLRVPYASVPARRVSSPLDRLAARRIHIDGGRVDVAGLGDEAGVEVRRLRDVLDEAPARLEPYLAALAASHDGFVAQNTALLDDGVVVVVRAGTKAGPLHLAYSGGVASPAFATPRAVVVAERGSELDLVESHAGDGEYLENAVTEVFVGEGASVEHVRMALGSERSAAVATIAVRQSRDSRYRSRILSFGGSKLTRVDLRVELAEQGAECSLDGVFLADGGSLVDHHTRVVHGSPRCTSSQRYRGIADGHGVGVFDGTVIVRPGASGTEAHQESRNLLLSNDATVHAKPHLEIDTDDVRCSHGATVGRLDPAQLFYLRSRGIDESVARSLLTYAFAREVVSGVGRADVREVLEEIVADRLPSGLIAKELA
ncbi:MAG TPA: Fe-S cluster assembly protein SufD [Polyangiaceae bacterium]|nr:Fe-S cluster assembly protein SufD [Polyangiaceae bacterium]